MDAADIMFKMADVYSRCTSYQDRGIVRHYESDTAGGEAYRHRVAFKTIYRAPDQFYFEWAEPPVGDPETATHRVSAFWTDGDKTIQLFQSQPGAKICPSLDYAIAASAGISKGASVTVAAYILPSLQRQMRTLFRLKEVLRLADEEIDGITCYVLKGQTWSGGEETLWIDANTFLLRRTRVGFVIKPGVDEAQYQAIKKSDPAQAEEYRKFRQAQTEDRRFWNQIEYHEASVENVTATNRGPLAKFDPQQPSDLVPSFAVL